MTPVSLGYEVRRFHIDLGSLHGSSSPLAALSWQRLNPIKLAYIQMGQMTGSINSQCFKPSQYADSPGNRACCYTELAVQINGINKN